MDKQYEDGVIQLVAKKDMTQDDFLQSSQLQHYDFDAWDKLMGEDDTYYWGTQMIDSLERMIPYGRMRILELFDESDKQTGGSIAKVYDKAFEAAREKAQTVTQPFNMSVTYEKITKKETYIEVPREVRKGFFRKETIYEKKKQVESFREPIMVKFNGWRLMHFERQYIWNAGTEGYVVYDNWDFCLGEDGELYHVMTSYTRYNETSTGSPDYRCSVRKVLPVDNCTLQNKNQNLFVAVTHGLLCAADAIPIDFDQTFGYNFEQERYLFNFPTQLSKQDYAFPAGEGIIARINSLK